ncbi:alpha/beta fold hydrolase [Niabella beijingensis]|uniref:alpha/beta fold hydrolase n=1 Tax=Niabella beijingensis TaxID=2872700 RepID=UPI001CC00117|nr:alpha/beta hydrolase [Niabella beijingensis]MBZ4192003.1 alpha/beta hydrolase [Niabella beijingensis]
METNYYNLLLLAALIAGQHPTARATISIPIHPLNYKTMKTTIDSMPVTHQYTTVNGIRYHYAEAGKGPLVVLLHGFPELWYSWRYQLTALAQAGYHAVAPDLRGFGGSEVTPRTRDYSLFQHARDVKALIDQIGGGQVVLVGHDWGANLMWLMAQLYPETVRAVAALSIPFYPEPRDPAVIRQKWSSVFTNFERKGIVEAEFESDPEGFFNRFFYGLSGDAPEGTVEKLYTKTTPDDRLLTSLPLATTLPAWLSRPDLEYYVTAYKKTGITGALGFYRNTDADYPGLKEAYKKGIRQPALFIGGAKEAAVKFGSTEPMMLALPNLREVIILEGCGHWIQQERPQELNAALIRFINQEWHR